MDKEQFVATILASAIGTLVMGLFANVPLHRHQEWVKCIIYIYSSIRVRLTWEQALAMVLYADL